MSGKTPTQNMDEMEMYLSGWEANAPTKTIGGLTLDAFKAEVDERRDDRHGVAEAKNAWDAAIITRENGDNKTMTTLDMLKKAIVADPEFGDDSALYESFGFIRKSDRKSGLTRKKRTDGNNS